MSVAVSPSPIINLDGGTSSPSILSTPKQEPSSTTTMTTTTMTTPSTPTTTKDQKSTPVSTTPDTEPESPSRNSIASPSSTSSPSTPSKRRSMANRKKSNQPGFLGVIMQALHPTACMNACHGGGVLDETHEKPYSGHQLDLAMKDVIAGLTVAGAGDNSSVDTIDVNEARFVALEALHVLVDKDHAYNRIPVVCNSEWNIIQLLTNLLKQCHNADDADEECSRLILLILNNLSIPFDNKAVMVLGPIGTSLIEVLLDVISSGSPITYLCCVCLMNLSILEDSKTVLTTFIPSNSTNTKNDDSIKKNDSSITTSTDPLQNPRSLLRTLEHMIGLYSTLITSTSKTQNAGGSAPPPPVVSVESQAVLWSMGLFRNLATKSENSILISQTTIPSIASSCISNSRQPICKWTRDSLEDMCLGLLVCLIQCNDSIKILKTKTHQSQTIINNLEIIVGEPGIHGMRASLICKQLQPKHNLAEI